MIFNKFIHIENKNLKIARHFCLIFCLILGLISSMILSFYRSTEILFQYYLGYTVLRLSVFYFACTIVCSTIFDKFFKKK